MKKTMVLLMVLTLALVGCDNGNNGTGNGTDKPGEKPGGGTYAKELWGEWLRMDTGDKWYISDDSIKINGANISVTASLNKQSERVVEVTDEGRKYYLYASRVANASFTGSIAGSTGGTRAVIGNVRVAIANLGNKSDTSNAVTNAEGVFTANGIIPGDAYTVTPAGGTPITVIPANDGADVGVVTVTSGVNFKTSISPVQASIDMNELYINENYSLNLEFENVGDEDCPAPSYTIVAPDGVTINGNLQGILGTIEPRVKKSVPISVICTAVDNDYEYKRISVTIKDGTGKTWEDLVSLRFYKETIDFNIKAQESISGVVITPDAKTYSFTNVTNRTVAVPRRKAGDYLVVFSGATIDTETSYALGIGIEAEEDFETFIATSRYEPNNTESETASLGEQRIMAYLHKNDIDYYRVSYNNVHFPSTPTNVRAGVVDAKVTVSWDAASDANSYNVYRSGSQTGTYTKVGAPTSPSYIDTVLSVGTYYYKVSAVSADGFESAHSASTSATVTSPSAPTNVSAGVMDAKVTVSWFAVPGANSYNVYRSVSQTGTYTKIGASESPTYIDTVFARGTYYYKVSAVSADGFESVYSEPMSATATGPSAPTNVSASIVDVEVTVSWNAVLGANSYNVYRSGSQTGTYTKIGASTSLLYIDTVGGVGTYYYKVSAVSVDGLESAYSTPTPATVSIEIEVAALTDTLSEVAANAVDFTYYTLLLGRDETIPAQTLSYSGKTVMIILKGSGGERTVNLSGNGSLFTVGNGVTLVLDDGVTLNGHSNNTVSLVSVDSGGTLLLKDGAKISGNTASNSYSYGGGVYVSISGTFEMSGGEISGNTTTVGGGVYMNGRFEMSGGTISGNTASSGGGVFVGGTFEMSGGTISGNRANYSNGGGVYVGGTFEMSGGTISGNRANYYRTNSYTHSDSYGGGVYVYNGRFTKQSGGTIYGGWESDDSLKNTAYYGHAVYVESGSKERSSTAGVGVTLDSGVSGSAGGWE
jgi:fibronectin type 3 domain-containing protein/uncharacterized lipoprotein NlpE involved in copper resistance